ncbi:MAG: PepSY domain-containing protein [Labilithrix sp.]|nr:PepSY domain-containing protein [Labilithrix sp.]MCW5812510.1 PepSY domain-containing protein [Labilithrix sp.]
MTFNITAAWRRWRSPGVAMRFVRRVHMYLGLVLFPWVLFFGVTGLSFNHPRLRGVTERVAPARQEAWSAADIATRIVGELGKTGDSFTLDPGVVPRFSGTPTLTASAADGGEHVVVVRLDDGLVVVDTRPPKQKRTRPSFAGTKLPLADRSMTALESNMTGLLPSLGLEGTGPLRAHPKSRPEVRFGVRDRDGVLWNAAYDLSSGAVDAQRADAPGARTMEVLADLHTTHRYPVHGGARTYWILFADVTACTLVFWALSGIAMWLQMKGRRAAGVVALSSGLLVAALVMTSTARDNGWLIDR